MPRKAAKVKFLDKNKKQREDWSKRYKNAEVKRYTVSGGGMINGETVTLDGSVGGLFLSSVPSGTTVSNRLGNQIRPVGLKGSVTLSLVQPAATPIVANTAPMTINNITPTSLTHHVVIALDRQSNGLNLASQPATENYFRSIFTTYPGTGQVTINYDNKDRFDVLYHKTVVLHNMWQPTKHLRFNIPLDLFNIQFGAGATQPITNSLVLYVYNGGNPPFTNTYTQNIDSMLLSRMSAVSELYYVDQ